MFKKILLWSGIALLFILTTSTTYGSFYYYKQAQKYKEDVKVINEEILTLKQATKSSSADADADSRSDSSSANESDSSDKSSKITSSSTSSVSTTGWQTYTNPQYGYKFKYPANYVTGCSTKPCPPHISESGGGDEVTLQGDISTVGWPNIRIAHLSSNFYNPPTGTNLISWISSNLTFTAEYLPTNYNILVYATTGDGAPGVDFTIPASPQAYSERYIYYVNSGKMFAISMTDVTASGASDFYDAWFENFKIN